MTNNYELIECVPNFSEGQDKKVIDSIVQSISAVDDVTVLQVDPGYDTNRTVVTFIGRPEAVVEAAYQGVKCAQQLIDMSKHHGTHPRIGATDVLPLIPVRGITLEECAELARALAKRIADELLIPIYCYEAAAFKPQHRNLAVCRKGEYEGLRSRVAGGGDGPDFGDREWDDVMARSGATVLGARNFLIAVNFNLNTNSKAIAHEIAKDVREIGRPGKPGTLKGVKAIGWYIEEYGFAQVSMNITDVNATPLQKAYDEVCRAAKERGVEATGTEIIGLLPEKVIEKANSICQPL